MNEQETEAIVNLRCVAALAVKIANSLEQRKLWPGDLDKAVAQMHGWLAEVKE